MSELTWEQKRKIVEKKSLFCFPYIGETKYAGAKKMTQTLKELNTAIRACWEIVNLYEGSELANQHSHEVTVGELGDMALKLENIRAILFGDSLNYDRIVELAESQVDEIDRLERELEGKNEQ